MRPLVRKRYSYKEAWARLIVEPIEALSFVMSRKMLRGSGTGPNAYGGAMFEPTKLKCSECGAEFHGRPNRKTCSPECRTLHKARQDNALAEESDTNRSACLILASASSSVSNARIGGRGASRSRGTPFPFSRGCARHRASAPARRPARRFRVFQARLQRGSVPARRAGSQSVASTRASRRRRAPALPST